MNLQNFKNDYLVVHVPIAPSILGYPYVGISSTRSTLKKYMVFIHFKLILESCVISGVYLETYETSMM